MGQRGGASSIMSGDDGRARRTTVGGPYAYRCPLCRTTSEPVETKAEARAEGQDHRDEFHGGHHPDGEEIIRVAPEPMQWADVPRGQKIATVVLALALLLGVWIKTF
jgi:hypothetical protein